MQKYNKNRGAVVLAVHDFFSQKLGSVMKMTIVKKKTNLNLLVNRIPNMKQFLLTSKSKTTNLLKEKLQIPPPEAVRKKSIALDRCRLRTSNQ